MKEIPTTLKFAIFPTLLFPNNNTNVNNNNPKFLSQTLRRFIPKFHMSKGSKHAKLLLISIQTVIDNIKAADWSIA